MNIVEIKVTTPLVIFTDSHTDILSIQKLLTIHHDCQFICLGDITNLWNENKDRANHTSIEFFTELKIPCLEGNHEAQLLACESGTGLLARDIFGSADYDLTQQHIDYLRSLPRGFKLVLQNATYLAYHNSPRCLWSFTKPPISKEQFVEKFPLHEVDGILIGHQHTKFCAEFEGLSCKLHGIGALKFGEYAILTEKGLEHKRLTK